jgi:hypothetical protein
VRLGSLSGLQERILALLAGIEPRWTLTGVRIDALARADGLENSEAAELAAFRDVLVERLTAEARPGGSPPESGRPGPGS